MNLEYIFTKLNVTLVGYIILFPIFFIWILGIIHTTVDIVRRTDNILYEFLYMILSAFGGPIGWLIYLVTRPKFTIEERLVYQAILINFQECTDCGQLNPSQYKYCINCGQELKILCKECKKEYYKGYGYCPYCGAPNLEIE